MLLKLTTASYIYFNSGQAISWQQQYFDPRATTNSPQLPMKTPNHINSELVMVQETNQSAFLVGLKYAALTHTTHNDSVYT